MREILFKAKQTNNAQWVEGYFFKDGEKNCYIQQGDTGLYYLVNPETGTVIKDYTTVEGHTFNNVEKMSMARQTLFIVDRNAHTVTGIPVEKLN